jgi:hypothetical protein
VGLVSNSLTHATFRNGAIVLHPIVILGFLHSLKTQRATPSGNVTAGSHRGRRIRRGSIIAASALSQYLINPGIHNFGRVATRTSDLPSKSCTTACKGISLICLRHFIPVNKVILSDCHPRRSGVRPWKDDSRAHLQWRLQRKDCLSIGLAFTPCTCSFRCRIYSR